MSKGDLEEQILNGLGIFAGAAGIATIDGAGSAVTVPLLAKGISAAIAAAPTSVQAAIFGGNLVAGFLAPIAPVVAIGGLVYAGVRFIQHEAQ